MQVYQILFEINAIQEAVKRNATNSTNAAVPMVTTAIAPNIASTIIQSVSEMDYGEFEFLATSKFEELWPVDERRDHQNSELEIKCVEVQLIAAVRKRASMANFGNESIYREKVLKSRGPAPNKISLICKFDAYALSLSQEWLGQETNTRDKGHKYHAPAAHTRLQ